MTKEELGTLILNSERQLYSTAKTILINDQEIVRMLFRKRLLRHFQRLEL